MPRDLFGNVTRPSISIGNRKWYTVPVSLLSHAAIVLLLIAIPILAPSAMPSVFADDDPAWIKIDLPDPPPPPVRPTAAPPQPAADPNAFPIDAPIGITEEKPRPELSDPIGPDLVLGDPSSFTREVAPPPVQVAPPAAVRIGGVVRTPTKVHHVNPVYPQLALLSHVQGIVIIEATIGADGRVIDARVLRSEPLLKQAALDAVSQWEFTPTMLNGVPVPVIMTVTVQFTLK